MACESRYNVASMRASQSFLPTLREAPQEAELASHQLLLRGGFIKRLSAGVYSYLPLGLRVLSKIAGIIREEANRAGAIELLMPTLVPVELLKETGRDQVEVLYRTIDRTDKELILGFTHEEVITDIARTYLSSYRDLPICLYQIQTKFRDEPRPRGGLMRGKEFLMYDAYSFDSTDEAAHQSYMQQRQAYQHIFARVGLDVLICQAEAGDIGGSDNEEFMVKADAGEDSVLIDEKTGIAANAERCDVGGTFELADFSDCPHAELVKTPDQRTVEEVTGFLHVSPEHLVKTLLLSSNQFNKPIAALVRGDRELNLAKVARHIGVSKVNLLSSEDVIKLTGADVGFAGPIGLSNIFIIADQEIRAMKDFIVGANQNDAHFLHVCHGRDFVVDQFADLRTAVDGDLSTSGGVLREIRGIEVGHIFKLGCKYSESMGATFNAQDGSLHPMIMGCYGLGVSRTLQAIVEVHHDESGIIWPISVAPYTVVIVIVNSEDELQNKTAETIYNKLLEHNIEVILDDRDERAGIKFKDADLIGYPLRITCGRGSQQGRVEIKWRNQKEAIETTIDDAIIIVINAVLTAKKDLTPV